MSARERDSGQLLYEESLMSMSIYLLSIMMWKVSFFVVFLSSAECLVQIDIKSKNTGWKTINPSIGLNGQRYCIWWFVLFWNDFFFILSKTFPVIFDLLSCLFSMQLCIYIYWELGRLFLAFDCSAAFIWQTIKHNWILPRYFFFILHLNNWSIISLL